MLFWRLNLNSAATPGPGITSVTSEAPYMVRGVNYILPTETVNNKKYSGNVASV